MSPFGRDVTLQYFEIQLIPSCCTMNTFIRQETDVDIDIKILKRK